MYNHFIENLSGHKIEKGVCEFSILIALVQKIFNDNF